MSRKPFLNCSTLEPGGKALHGRLPDREFYSSKFVTISFEAIAIRHFVKQSKADCSFECLTIGLTAAKSHYECGCKLLIYLMSVTGLEPVTLPCEGKSRTDFLEVA
jgi:hypothetical protein